MKVFSVCAVAHLQPDQTSPAQLAFLIEPVVRSDDSYEISGDPIGFARARTDEPDEFQELVADIKMILSTRPSAHVRQKLADELNNRGFQVRAEDLARG